MYKKQQEQNYLEATSVLYFVLKWKKPLLIVTLVAVIGSVIFSGETFITPKYKSTVILFPASTNSVSKGVLEDHPGDKQDILAFGEEEQAEQLLQILNSNEIRDRIAGKYKLMSHYHIDATKSYPYTQLESEYSSNITFQRTEFMSIRIDVMDEDPQMAADIANDIAAFADSMKNKIQHTRALEAVRIIEDEYNQKHSEIASKEDSLRMIQGLGIYDYGIQNQVLNEEYGKAKAIYTNGTAALPVLEKYRGENDTMVIATRAHVQGAEAQIKDLEVKLAVFSKYGSSFNVLKDELWRNREQLSKIKERSERIKADAEENLTSKFIVNNAVRAEKKSYPIRWLIVLVFTMSAFLFALLLIFGIEKYNSFKTTL
jgi:capsular polysaccharide biosynthesis protein